jgi:hypothetical protein
MKKIILSFALLLVCSGMYAQSSSSALSGKVNEGIIVYSVEWKLPEQMQAMAASLPTELTVYFKGDSSSLKSESAMFSSTNIINVNKGYERLLLDIPMMGKKFSVVYTPADQERIAENTPNLTLKESAEIKTIAGFKTVKHNVNESKSNENSEAWFTKDIEITQNPLSKYFNASYGVPIEFISYMNGASVKATVKEIKAGAVPVGSFSASKDFEEITFEQLMQMQGGR